jgi:hypothetical protein
VVTKQSSQTIPPSAFLLGWAGVIPFAALALQVATGWPLGGRMTGPALYLLTTYGALILSFMGGAQWGLAVAAPEPDNLRRFGLSVLPALLAWLGLWIGAKTGLLLMAGGFAALLAYDLWTVARGEAPHWYGRLRRNLSVAVIGCLLAAALLGPF